MISVRERTKSPRRPVTLEPDQLVVCYSFYEDAVSGHMTNIFTGVIGIAA